MALVKLFRITDTEGQRYHVAAATFSDAISKMRAWENDPNPYQSDDDVVQAVEIVEDLLAGGTRDEDVCSDRVLLEAAVGTVYAPPQDWTYANNMAAAARGLLTVLPSGPAGIVAHPMSEYIKAIEALRDAVDIYEQIPF